jgi:hypothetical protein
MSRIPSPNGCQAKCVRRTGSRPQLAISLFRMSDASERSLGAAMLGMLDGAVAAVILSRAFARTAPEFAGLTPRCSIRS